MAGTAAWLERFEPFGPVHLLTVLLWLGLAAALVALGRSLRGSSSERRLRSGFGLVILVSEVAYQAWENLGGRFDPLYSLPLHACDLVVWCAVLALLTEWRWARSLTYFVGLGLSSQTFFTPTLHEGPAHLKFWLFWATHTQIVAAAAYLLAVCSFVPRRSDYLVAILVSALYVAAIVPIDLALGANYGYVGDSRPDAPTILDALGPWPFRILSVLALTVALFTVMWLVPRWIVRRRRGLA
jgi:hypothetical integral membrane protein (TIGR02206 family)